MAPEKFIDEYSAALASQDWNNVAPLIHEDACVTFSDGSVYQGVLSIAEAYKRNFMLIKNEEYHISDVHWIKLNDAVAVYLFRFTWRGTINGQEASGGGRGTATIMLDKGRWKLMAEHLGPKKN
jgi:ketosteroid isomerase-like protein